MRGVLGGSMVLAGIAILVVASLVPSVSSISSMGATPSSGEANALVNDEAGRFRVLEQVARVTEKELNILERNAQTVRSMSFKRVARTPCGGGGGGVGSTGGSGRLPRFVELRMGAGAETGAGSPAAAAPKPGAGGLNPSCPAGCKSAWSSLTDVYKKYIACQKAGCPDTIVTEKTKYSDLVDKECQAVATCWEAIELELFRPASGGAAPCAKDGDDEDGAEDGEGGEGGEEGGVDGEGGEDAEASGGEADEEEGDAKEDGKPKSQREKKAQKERSKAQKKSSRATSGRMSKAQKKSSQAAKKAAGEKRRKEMRSQRSKKFRR